MDKITVQCKGSDSLDIGKLVPFQGALKTLSKDNYLKLKAEILADGFSFPVFVWQNEGSNYIIDGHQRVNTLVKMQEEGYQVPPIPVAYIHAHTYKQAKRKVLAAASVYGRIDEQGLYEFLEGAGLDIDEIVEKIDLPYVDLDKFKAGYGPESVGLTDPDAIPDTPKKAKTKPGDLYQLGDHRLLCGDSTDQGNVDTIMENQTPILMVTDPPYGIEYDAEWRGKAGAARLGKNRTGKVSNDTRADWFEVWDICKADVAYVWHASAYADVVMDSLRRAKFEVRQQIIWNKSVMAMSRSAYHWKHEPCWYAVRKGKDANWKGDRKQITVWEAASPSHIMSGSKEEKTPHPTQKPAKLYEIPIENHTSPGGIIYEPFAGSGTAFIVAEKLGRVCLGIELDPIYCDVIVKRWEDFTGKKAELING